jgi:hypothetical protein
MGKRFRVTAMAMALVLLILIPSAGAQEPQRLRLDSTSSLGTTVSTDLVVKKEGKGSQLRLTLKGGLYAKK